MVKDHGTTRNEETQKVKLKTHLWAILEDKK